MEEIERLTTQERTEDLVQTEELISISYSLQEKSSEGKEGPELVNEYTDDILKLQRTKPDNRTLTKDIPLDHVSDCSYYGGSRRKNGATL